jgi:two-component system phosphate regulon sensor histidine kinase PhoR
MSLRLKFLLFLSCAVIAGLLVSSVWNLRTRLAIFFSLAAGAFLGKLFADWREELRGKTRADAEPPGEPKAEVDRLEAGSMLEEMMAGMREGVLVLDSEMRVVTSNRAAHEIFSQVKGEPEGRRLSELTRNPAIHSAFIGAVSRNEPAVTKVEMQGTGGPIFDLRVTPLKLDAGQGSRGAMGVFFDITRLERLERVRQEFLSNVSHELRTPLTAIIAFIETLEDGAIKDPENSLRFLSIIRKNAQRMHNLIDDILELSAIEAGTVSVKPEPVRLRLLVADILTALASRAAARSVNVRNEVSDDAVVFADGHRLEQMLTNLVDNAIKFNREGGEVSVTHERQGRDRILVADTGDGIPPEHVSRIFERFYRVDRARSREMGGTGLGLAIVKHLALAHGGTVSVRSSLGEGSTFMIELPTLQEDRPTELHAVSHPSGQPAASPAFPR